jgi:hypothetical protein
MIQDWLQEKEHEISQRRIKRPAMLGFRRHFHLGNSRLPLFDVARQPGFVVPGTSNYESQQKRQRKQDQQQIDPADRDQQQNRPQDESPASILINVHTVS